MTVTQVYYSPAYMWQHVYKHKWIHGSVHASAISTPWGTYTHGPWALNAFHAQIPSQVPIFTPLIKGPMTNHFGDRALSMFVCMYVCRVGKCKETWCLPSDLYWIKAPKLP